MNRSKQPSTRPSRPTSVTAATAAPAHANHQQSPSSGQQNSHRAKSWTSASSAKFSRILNNLERSIMNQFNGNQATIDDEISFAAESDGRLAQKEFSQSTTMSNNQKIVNISAPQPPPKPASKMKSEQNGAAQQVATNDKVDVVPGKATLSKYQQPTVSTLRPDHQCQQHNQLMLNSNSSNKLSIPPPHANDKARNQNHRLIFGSPNSIAHTKHHSQQVLSPDPLKTQSESCTLNRCRRSHIIKLDDAKQQQQHNATSAKPNNLSPASSAKSLPVVLKTTSSLINNNKLAGSQLANENNKQQALDNYDSGFLTYQSRRSFIQLPPPTLQQQQVPKSSEQTTSNNSSNMLIMQTTQVPLASITTTSYNPTTNRQFLYQFQPQQQLRPLNTHHQQQYIQPQQFVTNQVPIVTTNSQIFTPLHHPTTQHQQHYSYRNQSSSAASNGMANMALLAVDSGQEIYANAPPKPRRYQYYDLNQHHTMLPHLAPHTPTSVTTNAISNGCGAMSNNNNTFIQYNRPLFPQQQLIPNSTFKLSYLPVQQIQATGTPFINKVTRYVPQQVAPGMLHSLTKSKSSLDACDLARFKLENRTAAPRPEADVPHSHYLKQNQPTSLVHYPSQQHLVYDSRLNISNVNANQLQNASTTNLQRSKSVTHLLTDHERHQMNQHLAINDRQHDQHHQAKVVEHQKQQPKFPPVSSASTTNINFVGVHQQPAKIPPSHQLRAFNSHHVQQPAKQQDDHHQLYSATSLRQQQQKFSQHISKNYNDNANNNNQVNVNNSSFFSNQIKSTAPVFRQYQQLQEAGFSGSSNEPSLDDKIRYLMIGGTDVGTSMENKSHQSNNEVYQQQQQQPPTSSSQQSHPTSSWLCPSETVRQSHLLTNGSSRVIESLLLKKRDDDQSTNSYLNSTSAYSNHHHNIQSSDTANIKSNDYNVIYSSDIIASRMGNRQLKHNSDQLITNASGQCHPNNLDMFTSGGNLSTEKGPNSHLIVDLTTPRVLAKTQTTLPAHQQNTQIKQNKDSCSINQVGLPQLQSTNGNFINQQAHQSIKKSESSKTLNTINDNHQQAVQPISERTAPYYYSDLKSEEQRQALLSIVQQKSLSPPPQLLSRSTDLSSTRLTYKSATLHPAQNRVSSDLSQSKQKSAINLNKYSPTSEFSSTLNITKNIDKLFESPMQPRLAELHELQRMKPVRSMLALNNNTQQQHQQQHHYHQHQRRSVNLKADLESNDDKYYARSRSFSKSKSLEDLMSNACERMLTGDHFELTVPVYENIRRSDKLMSAIHNSTTCLSTLTSRTLGGSRRTNQINMTNGDNCHNNTPSKTSTHSDDSLDSILGTSLDDSDSSSLDIIDEIKISPSDNHLSDIIQLIEQLKTNHSKLSDEYKSIMIKIAKTINSNSSPASNVSGSNEKLGRRLQLLEMKSKKCESRSKNQLALIQMMEKVLKQSKVRGLGMAAGAATNNNIITSSRSLNTSSLEGSVGGGGCDSIESSSTKQSTNQSISSTMSDYQNVNSSAVTTADQAGPTFLGMTNKKNSITKQLEQQEHQQQLKAPIVKTVVTEATYAGNCISGTVQRVDKVVFDEMQHNNNNNNNHSNHQQQQQQQVSLSTRHQQNVKAAAAAMQTQSFVAVKDGNVGKKVTHIEQQNATTCKSSRENKNKTDSFSSNDSVSSSGCNSSTDSSCSSGPNGSNKNEYEDNDEVIDEEDMLANSVDHQQQRRHQQHHNRFVVDKQSKENNDDEGELTTSKPNGNGFDVMTRAKRDAAEVNGDAKQGDGEEEEEDFIEFLSTDGSSCLHHGGSQFEASQFSVSDFNTTSSTSTSESASSASGASVAKESNTAGDFLNLNLSTNSNPIKHRFSSIPQPPNSVSSSPSSTTYTNATITTTATNTGILKNCTAGGRKQEERSNKEKEEDEELEDELEEDEELVVRSTRGSSSKKFNNVLGNVIDVDVCPTSKLSQSSPVNNQTSSCLN